MKATRSFVEQVLRKRPELQPEWCERVVATPIRREVQDDGRVISWGEVLRPGETAPRILRVVTLDDCETIHDASFRKDEP